MGFVIFTFFVIFLLIASGGLLLFYRQAMIQRISTVINPRAKTKGSLSNIFQQTSSSLGGMVERFDRVLPKSQAEVSVTQQRLIRAGYRDDSAVKLFYGFKVLVPLFLCVLITVTGLTRYASPFILYVVALGLGFLVPDFWLGRRISLRQASIRRGLPDVLDLLVICIEAGLSLDQAMARTAQEVSLAQPVLSDELSIVVLEQQAGCPRADAWKHFAERSGVESVRNLVSVLVQSEQFGTSVGRTLRVHSDTLRTQRRLKVEEQAAKTTIKLVFPLVLFIFPSLFLVTLGPAAIIIMESFHNLLGN
ncbi:MAG TPA: type II secretion system F family protein [Acidobacteriaceae bacterium]|jgi:tight adherence protein C|nr:type II secretion system F family protein [Acidobacteriaceae bacterium]